MNSESWRAGDDLAVTLGTYEPPTAPIPPIRGNELTEPRLPVAPNVGGWVTKALCSGAGPDLWYSSDTYTEARAVCLRCPVRVDCLEHALEAREKHGMWGGLSSNQRKLLAADRRRDAA